ncbi:MAG: hypothetical protein LM573_02210 [Thermofilum sp.]|nr:hypothetical protein [Thermofilum sp.]
MNNNYTKITAIVLLLLLTTTTLLSIIPTTHALSPEDFNVLFPITTNDQDQSYNFLTTIYWVYTEDDALQIYKAFYIIKGLSPNPNCKNPTIRIITEEQDKTIFTVKPSNLSAFMRYVDDALNKIQQDEGKTLEKIFKEKFKKIADKIKKNIQENPSRTYNAIADCGTSKAYAQVWTLYPLIVSTDVLLEYITNGVKDYALLKTDGLGIIWASDDFSYVVLKNTNPDLLKDEFLVNDIVLRDIISVTLRLYWDIIPNNATIINYALSRSAPLGLIPIAYPPQEQMPGSQDKLTSAVTSFLLDTNFRVLTQLSNEYSPTAVKVAFAVKLAYGDSPLAVGNPACGLDQLPAIKQSFLDIVAKIYKANFTTLCPTLRIKPFEVGGKTYYLATVAFPYVRYVKKDSGTASPFPYFGAIKMSLIPYEYPELGGMIKDIDYSIEYFDNNGHPLAPFIDVAIKTAIEASSAFLGMALFGSYIVTEKDALKYFVERYLRGTYRVEIPPSAEVLAQWMSDPQNAPAGVIFKVNELADNQVVFKLRGFTKQPDYSKFITDDFVKIFQGARAQTIDELARLKQASEAARQLDKAEMYQKMIDYVQTRWGDDNAILQFLKTNVLTEDVRKPDAVMFTDDRIPVNLEFKTANSLAKYEDTLLSEAARDAYLNYKDVPSMLVSYLGDAEALTYQEEIIAKANARLFKHVYDKSVEYALAEGAVAQEGRLSRLGKRALSLLLGIGEEVPLDFYFWQSWFVIIPDLPDKFVDFLKGLGLPVPDLPKLYERPSVVSTGDEANIQSVPSDILKKVPPKMSFTIDYDTGQQFVIKSKQLKNDNQTLVEVIPIGVTSNLEYYAYLVVKLKANGTDPVTSKVIFVPISLEIYYRPRVPIEDLIGTPPTTFNITYKNYDHVNPFNPAWTPPGNWTYVNHISDYTGANTTFWLFDPIDDPMVLIGRMNPSPINGTWIISSQHIGSQFFFSGYDYVVRATTQPYYVSRFAIALRILINGTENIPENYTYNKNDIQIFNNGRGILIYPTFLKQNGTIWLDLGSFSLIYSSQHVTIPVTNRWIVIVVDFPPNDTPSVQVYDEHGQLLGEAPLLTFTSDWSFFDLGLSVPPYEDTNATWTIQIDWIAERIGTAPDWTRTQIFGFAGSISNETRILELYRNGVLVKTLNLISYYHSTLIFIDNSSDTYEVDYMVLRDAQGHIVQTIDGIYLKKESDLSMNLYFSTRIPPPQYVVIYSDTNNRTKTPPGPRIKPAKGKS